MTSLKPPASGGNGMASPTNGGDAADQAGAQPNFNVITQYLKDFSFENPNGPKSLMQPQQQPQITIQINVNCTANKHIC
jgi:preprotein translocase subunit SecB